MTTAMIANSAHESSAPSNLDWALRYVASGLKVLPLNEDCLPGTCDVATCKRPKSPHGLLVPNGLHDATTDPDVIRQWFTQAPFANIGIANRASGKLTVDLDSHARDGIAYFDQLREELPYPETAIQITPGGARGGIHLVFNHPAVDVRAAIKTYDSHTKKYELAGIDMRSSAYIVACPSMVHGKTYRWADGYSIFDRPTLDVPDWLLKHIVKPAVAKLPDTLAFTDDGVETQERGIEILRGYGIVSKGDRNTTLYLATCNMKEIGLSLSVARALIGEHLKFEPPLTSDEIDKTTRSAYEGSQNEQGSKHPANLFKPQPPASGEAPVIDTPSRFPRNDADNAALLAAEFGHLIRWFRSEKNFLAWDGKRWRADNTERPIAYAKEISKILFQKAIADHELKFAALTGSASKVAAMLTLARPDLAITADQLDTDPFLLNCGNCTVDLRTGELHPHRQDDFITKLAPVDYDPDAKAPRFERFLHEIFEGSQPLIDFVQCALGLALTGSTKEQKLFVAHGAGANGKSTLFGALSEIMGDYAQATEPSLLFSHQRNSDGPSEGIYRLRGARLATTIESDEEIRLNEALVKHLTGSDRITARPLHGHFAEFDPTHKLWLVTNHLPRVKSQGNAIWRRIRLIPFSVIVPQESRDKDLPDKLRAENPGILAWLVRGCIKWLREGLPECPEVMHATAGYRNEEDTLAEFIRERCVLAPSARVQASILRKAYEAWCSANSEAPHNKRVFAIRMQEKFKESTTNGRSFWVGIGIVDTQDGRSPESAFAKPADVMLHGLTMGDLL